MRKILSIGAMCIALAMPFVTGCSSSTPTARPQAAPKVLPCPSPTTPTGALATELHDVLHYKRVGWSNDAMTDVPKCVQQDAWIPTITTNASGPPQIFVTGGQISTVLGLVNNGKNFLACSPDSRVAMLTAADALAGYYAGAQGTFTALDPDHGTFKATAQVPNKAGATLTCYRTPNPNS